MTSDWDRLEELFLAALDVEPAQRDAWLDRECGDEPKLRTELEDMLLAHDGDELQVESRLLGSSEEPSLSGERLGPYRLLTLIGRGGMGEVYLAERDDQLYERKVAIKLVQFGPRASLRERFARERSILARLTHPNVATLYDGGVTEDGRPYLVMEYVDGVPITEYCDARRLNLRERIELFITVCEALQFAHGALVIHRDLKPSNILVDTQGSVKLLDFGIAKLLEEEDTEAVHTTTLDRVLTPEHAAPEQIRGEDPTTATDVYGLGVLLCELLVGERPLRFPTRSPVEIDRIAREVEALAPSKLLSRMETAPREECASRRSTNPERLARSLRGDLDAICAKALRKESEGRYSSASGFISDLRRHLDSRPVHAVQGTRSYNARKFCTRHRTSLVLSAVAFLMLAGFLMVSLQQAHQVRTQRDRAQREVDRADLVLARLVELFESTQPEVLDGPDMLDVSEFLMRGEETAELLGGESETQQRMYEILAEIYATRGDLDRAVELIERARDLSIDPLQKLRLAHQYALLRTRRDGPEVGVPLLRASLAKHRELLGDDHPDISRAMQSLGTHVPDRAERRELLEEALRIEESRPVTDNALRASCLNALAVLEIGLAHHNEARLMLEEADSLLAASADANSLERMSVRHNLGAVYARQGRWDLAVTQQEQLVRQRRERHGASSDLTANALESYAVTLANLGRHRESGEAFAEALAIFERTLDPMHWRIANENRNVGQLLALQGRYDEALPFLDRSVQINRTNDPEGRSTFYVRGQRALIWLGLGEVERAKEEMQRVILHLDDPDDENPGVYAADGRIWLGIVQMHANDPGSALPCFERALQIRGGLLGDAHPKYFEALLGAGLAGRAMSDEEFSRVESSYRDWGLAHPLLLALLEAPQH